MRDFTGAVQLRYALVRDSRMRLEPANDYLRDADMDAAWVAGRSQQMVKRERLGQATRAWNQAARIADRPFQTLNAELAGAGICLSASASRLRDNHNAIRILPARRQRRA